MGMSDRARKPLILHVLDRFDIGGMEIVALNLITHTRDRYDHRVLCLRDVGRLAGQLQAVGIPVDTIGKQPGKDIGAYLRVWKYLRNLHPDVVHTYNIGAIDVAFWARLAGVGRVVHAEHGRDVSDPNGSNNKYRWLRRILAPAISRFVPVSEDLERWLRKDVGMAADKVELIHNGIDTTRYRPGEAGRQRAERREFAPEGATLIGSVGRLDAVKAFDTLIAAVAELNRIAPACNPHLVIVGDGPERAALDAQIDALGVAHRVTLAGLRHDIDEILPNLDIYACSSIAEGIALTLLEAMASGLPIVATRVGGNPELVVDGQTGRLVPSGDSQAMAAALRGMAESPDDLKEMGRAARERVCERFSLETMNAGYSDLYARLLAPKPSILGA
jgi:sugar transferase (PEP-CTERM/EpsH1 system associated)